MKITKSNRTRFLALCIIASLLAICFATVLVACNKDKSSGKNGDFDPNNLTMDDITPLLGYVNEAIKEEGSAANVGGLFIGEEYCYNRFSMENKPKGLIGCLYNIHYKNNNQNISLIRDKIFLNEVFISGTGFNYVFDTEENAINAVPYFMEEFIGSEDDEKDNNNAKPFVYQKEKHIYVEQEQGYWENVIMKSKLKKGAISDTNLKFIKDSIFDIKNRYKNTQFLSFSYGKSNEWNDFLIGKKSQENFNILNVSSGEEYHQCATEYLFIDNEIYNYVLENGDRFSFDLFNSFRDIGIDEASIGTHYTDDSYSEVKNGYRYQHRSIKPGFRFEEIDNGNSYEISDFYCTDTVVSVTIPSSYNNKPVTRIGIAFETCSELTSIVIPNSITTISDFAFHYCYNLKDIYISDIAKWCEISWIRSNCNLYLNGELVTNLVIPDTVTRINNYAFYGFQNITSVTIPDSVTSIGIGAFANTAWYDSQPDGLVYAGKVAYKYKGDMPADTSITLKEGTKGITNSAFKNCTNLTSITIPDGVTSIGSDVFYGCSGLTSIVIPDGVTSIGSDVFYGCSGLTSIVIPDSVTSIDSDAFANTAWYDSQPDGLVYAGKVAYKYKGTMPANTSITLKEGTTQIYDYAFYGCSGLTSIVIPDSVTSIDSNAFYGCNNLNAVYITDIAKWCGINFSVYRGQAYWLYKTNPLYYAHNLYLNGELVTDLIIPDTVTEINKEAFHGCTCLTNVTIPSSVTNINSCAFEDCGSINITIPVSVTNINNAAFRGSDVKITYKGTKQQWFDLQKRRDFGENSITVTCSDGVFDINEFIGNNDQQ